MIINMEKYSTSIRFYPPEEFNFGYDKLALQKKLKQRAYELVDKAFAEIGDDDIEYDIYDDDGDVVLGGTIKFGFGIEGL